MKDDWDSEFSMFFLLLLVLLVKGAQGLFVVISDTDCFSVIARGF